MKKTIRLTALLIVVGLFGYASQSAWSQAYNTQYTCKTTSVSSATVPANVLSGGFMNSWTIHTRSGSAVSALCFPYTTSAVPTAVPSPAAVMEIPAGSYFSDQVHCDTNTCRDGIGAPWACVLATGTTAITVDSCSR